MCLLCWRIQQWVTDNNVLSRFFLFSFLFPETIQQTWSEHLVSRRHWPKQKPACRRPHLRTHGDVRRKGEDSANKHRGSNILQLSEPAGTRKQRGPNTSNPPSEGHWCVLIATVQKGQKQSLAVLSAQIPLPKYPDTYNGLICVYRRRDPTVCVKSTLTKQCCVSRKWTLRVSRVFWERQHPRWSPFMDLQVKSTDRFSKNAQFQVYSCNC